MLGGLNHYATTGFDLDGTRLPTVETRYEDHDDFDNVQTLTQVTSDAGQVWSKTTKTQYSNNTSQWLLAKPTQIAVTHQAPSSQPITRTTTFSYSDLTGAMETEVIEPYSSKSKTLTNTYDTNGFVLSKQIQTADGQRRSQTTYDQWGRATSTINAKGHTATQTFDPVCNLVSTVSDANGNQVKYFYDNSCRKLRQENPDGSWSTTEYSWSEGLDLGTNDQQLGLDLTDNTIYKVTERSSTGFWSTTWYDQNDRPVRIAKWSHGNKTVLQDTVYNELGQVAASSVPYFATSVPGANHWIVNTYDSLGRLVKRTSPSQDGSRMESTVEHSGLTTSEISPLGRIKIITKNPAGETVHVNENGSNIYYSYNSLGELTQVNASGIVTTLEYDEFGNKIAQTDPAMGRWTYRHNAFGELIEQKDAKGQVVTMKYDVLGRIVERLEAEGQTTWQYDTEINGIGLPASVSSPSVSREFSYDGLGRLEAQLTTISGREFVTGYGYDGHSRVVSVFNPDGVEVRHDYNAAGQRIRVGLPKSDVWDYDYIALEDAFMETFERIQELDALALEYELKIEELIASAEEYRYAEQTYRKSADWNEQQAEKLSAYADFAEQQALRNAQIAEDYRSKAETYWKLFGEKTLKYVETRNGMARYEAKFCSSKNWKGHCRRHQTYRADIPVYLLKQEYYCTGYGKFMPTWGCPSGPQRNLHVGKLYDELQIKYSNLAQNSEAQAQNYTSQAETYENKQQYYEAKAADMQQRAEAYMARARHHSEQLSVISEELAQQKESYEELSAALDDRNNDDSNVYLWRATSFAATGQLNGELFGNGLQTSRSIHSGTGLTEHITTKRGGDILHSTSYQYDYQANVIARNDLGSADQIWRVDQTYAYDHKDRLQSWSLTDGDGNQQYGSYSYDSRHNLSSKSDAGDMEYNQANQLVRRTTPAGISVSYSYDANGNQLSGDGRNIAWTSFNKAAEITQNGQSAVFTYDENHSRAMRQEGNSTTYYVSGNFELTETHQGGETKTTSTHSISNGYETAVVYEKTLVDGEKQADQVSYLHRDAQGTVTIVTSGDGQIVQRRVTKPFGGDLNSISDQTTADYRRTANKGYTGHEQLPNFGLINMNARLYDPLTGRFLSADAVIPDASIAAAYNRYVYVYNNPVRYVDPSGHNPLFIIGAILFTVGATSDDPTVSRVGMIAGTVLMGAGAAGVTGQTVAQGGIQAAAANGALIGATTSFISSGGDVGQTVKGGVMGAVSGAVTYEIGYGFGGEGGLDFNTFEAGLAHGVFQGAMAELNGGSFRDGFVGGTIGHWSGGIGAKAFGDPSTNADWGAVMGRTAISAVAGGIVADATGGDFSDGAMTAAFVHLFNTEAQAISKRKCSGQMCRSAGQPSASERHYARNTENDEFFKEQGLFGRNDLTIDEILNAGEFGFKQASEKETAFHRNGLGNENNLKFTSLAAIEESWFQRTFSNRYGRYELIVRPNGNGTFTYVSEPINMGTLNRGNNPLTHFTRDVVPYLRFGNTPE